MKDVVSRWSFVVGRVDEGSDDECDFSHPRNTPASSLRLTIKRKAPGLRPTTQSIGERPTTNDQRRTTNDERPTTDLCLAATKKFLNSRLTATQYIVLAIFLVLAYGLWRLQVMESSYYSLAAEKNRIRNVPVLAPRGKILDREGRTIVDNYPSFTALLMRDSSRDLAGDADLIAQGLHLDANEVRARIRRSAYMPQYQPIFLKEDITPDELKLSSKPTATSCPSLKPSWRTAASIRARVSWRT